MTSLTQSGEVNVTHDRRGKTRVVVKVAQAWRRRTRSDFDFTLDDGRRDVVTVTSRTKIPPE